MANITQLSITPPAPFDFEFSAYSHGWVVLAPNSWDEAYAKLHRVERLSRGKVVSLEIYSSGTITKPKISIDVNHTGNLSHNNEEEIKAAIGCMFRVEDDFSEFYEICNKRGDPWKRMTAGLGRLLRSPTVFEDVIKTICTTNIQWGGTKRMVEGLVNILGKTYSGDKSLHAFPTPKVMAAAPPETYTETVRLGYRGDYIYTLAQRVASGELDLEAFNDESIPTPELKKELLAIKGVGNYAAATLLMLLGRYDELAVDTVFRSFVSKKYFAGGNPSDDETKEIYAPWGKWKFLAFWFDLWKDLEEEL